MTTNTTNAINATDTAIQLAAAQNVDLSTVKGSGKDGRITVNDVSSLIARNKAETPNAVDGVPSQAEGIQQDDDSFVEVLADAFVSQAKIADFKAAMTDEKETISGRLHNLAKYCDNVDDFLAYAKRAEDSIKATRKASNLSTKLPACWTQAKSNLKQGWIKGIQPKEFDTESAFRAHLNKVRKDEGNSQGGGAATSETAEAYDVDAGVRDRLSVFLAELAKANTDVANDVLAHGIEQLKQAAKLADVIPESITPNAEAVTSTTESVAVNQ